MNPTTLSLPPHTPTSSNKETEIPLQEEEQQEGTDEEMDEGTDEEN